MGGRNGGRKGGRPTTDGRRALDVRKLGKAGALTPGTRATLSWTRRGGPWGSIEVRGEAGRVILAYRCQMGDGDERTLECPVDLVRTPCVRGGSRPWFLCPRCGRRVALLYLGSHSRFACRTCEGLDYPSTRETDEGRAFRRADNLRSRLGWPPGIINGIGPRPRYMHRVTFQRLLDEYERRVNVILAADMRWLEGQKRPQK